MTKTGILFSFAILGALICSANLIAQNKVKWQSDFLEPHIGFETNYFQGSPSISDVFVQSYFDGNFLDAALKNETVSKLTARNIFGAYNNFKLSFTRPARLEYADLFHLSLENRNIMDMCFDEALFRLVFLGNKAFAGREIKATDNHLLYSGFTQLKAGYIKTFYMDRFDHTFGLIGALNAGTTHNYLYIRDASLLTAENNSFIDGNLRADMLWAKNKSDNAIKFINGLGGSLDFFYRFECDRGNNFSFAINDMGFMRWFEAHATTLHTDTSFYFDGINIDDFLNITASTDNLKADSLKEAFNELTVQKAFTTFLPLSFQAYFGHDFNDNLSMGAGYMNQPQLASKPFYFLDVKYRVLPFLMLVPNVSYGAYSRLSAGLDVVINYNEYFCYFGSDYLTSFADAGTFSGKGFYFKIVKKFNAYETASFKLK